MVVGVSRTRLGALVVTSVLAFVYAATSMVTALGAVTTYAGHSHVLAWFWGVGGGALLVAGIMTVAAGRRIELGALALVAGVLWFAPAWDGWRDGPELVRTLGTLAAGFVFPTVVHLVLSASVRPLPRASRAIVVASYALVGGGALLAMLVRDPFYDPACWTNCTANSFLLSSHRDLAATLVAVRSWLTIGLAAVFGAQCFISLTRGRHGFGQRWLVLPGGILFAVATICHELLLRRDLLEQPAGGAFASVFATVCIAVTLVAAGMIVAPVRARLQRRSVTRIISAVDEAPPVGGLGAALAASLGDPQLRIYYWLPTARYYANADGEEGSEPSPGDGLFTTPLVYGKETVAIVAHRCDPVDLERGLGPAARLALANERLQAEVRARMRELTESRARIVEAADANRRTLERDLHDGAQQTLLSMSYDLQAARATAIAKGDPELSALVETAVDEVRAAFRDLREIAHGIHPAVLDATGLGGSINAYATTSQVAADVECDVTERLPASVETAAYMVAMSVIDAAVSSGIERVRVAIARAGNTLTLEIHYQDCALDVDIDHLEDRVGAVGGRLLVTTDRITAELPCESLSPMM